MNKLVYIIGDDIFIEILDFGEFSKGCKILKERKKMFNKEYLQLLYETRKFDGIIFEGCKYIFSVDSKWIRITEFDFFY